MNNLNKEMVDKVARSCINLFNKLPKTGKPINEEWTVLSCVVKNDTVSAKIEVVSLGTGSKCIGATKMSPNGDVLNDSHAEVLARRGFLLYLYDNIDKAIENKPSIFEFQNGKIMLKDYVQFILYSSQLPCGDASIIPKIGQEEDFGEVLESTKRKMEQLTGDTKKIKLEEDIYRTGAKCLPHSEQDPKHCGTNYHLLGQVRTKPGRGDRTLSVSCSDKMAKWIHVGIQGSLLHLLIGPIYINHFIFGGGVLYNEKSLKRALLGRNPECSLQRMIPEIYQTTIIFPYIRTSDNIRPAPGSMVWTTNNLQVEVAVQGKKLGLTKKQKHLPSNYLCISKYSIYKRFHSILQKNINLKTSIVGEDDLKIISYNQMKKKSTMYLDKWTKVKEKFFKTWTVKPEMWNFCMGEI